MKLKELKKLDLETAVEKLQELGHTITDESALVDFVKEKLDNGNYGLAIHILESLWNCESESTYFAYDYSMGTLATPTPIETLKDLEKFCERTKNKGR